MRCSPRAAGLLVFALCGLVLGPDRVSASPPPPAIPPASPNQARPPAPQPKPPGVTSVLVALQVEPTAFLLQGKWATQTLRVTGRFANGTVHDVSAQAEYQSANPAIAQVTREGIVRTSVRW